MTTMAKKKPAPDQKPEKPDKPKVDDKDPWPGRLAKLQNSLGLSNADMADKMGVSRNTYQQWKYRQRPIPTIAQRLIVALQKQK